MDKDQLNMLRPTLSGGLLIWYEEDDKGNVLHDNLYQGHVTHDPAQNKWIAWVCYGRNDTVLTRHHLGTFASGLEAIKFVNTRIRAKENYEPEGAKMGPIHMGDYIRHCEFMAEVDEWCHS